MHALLCLVNEIFGTLSAGHAICRAVAMWHDAISELAPLDTEGLPLDGVEDIRDDVHRYTLIPFFPPSANHKSRVNNTNSAKRAAR